MKLKSFYTTGLGLVSSLVLSNAYAAVSTPTQAQEMQQILQETAALQKQVKALSAEVSELKHEKAVAQRNRPVTRRVSSSTRGVAPQHAVKEEQPNPSSQTKVKPSLYYTPTSSSNLGPTAEEEGPQTTPQTEPPPPGSPLLEAERITQGTTVTTSPLLGLRSAFDATDLLVNQPTMNEDLRLLQQRQTVRRMLRQAGLAPYITQDRPLVELSGGVEAQSFFQEPYQGSSVSDINLASAKFDVLAYASPWALALISYRFDNSPLSPQLQNSGQRIANSRIFLQRGFVTIGDLDKSPVYFSAGQMFVPFGRYSSYMLTNLDTQMLGQTNSRAALLGFYADGLYAEGYIFRGDVNTSSQINFQGQLVGQTPPPNVNDGGGNIGYHYEGKENTFEIGGGAIGNIADSLGMQITGGPANTFQGFATVSPPDFFSNEVLFHRVSGVDVHGEFDHGPLTLVTEYVGATKAFDERNLSYNFQGAQPKATHSEMDYQFKMFDWPSVFTLAYDHSWQALALALPQNSYVIEINTSIWKDTIETLEFRHDKNYSSSDFSSGNGAPIPVPSQGGSQNTATAQIGVYF